MVAQQTVAVQAFDHMVLPAMDLWRAERFYTQVLDGAIFQQLGLTFEEAAQPGPRGAFIKLGRHHIGVFLQTRTPVHPPAALDAGTLCLSIAVAAEDFAAVVDAVRAAGCAVGPERAVAYGVAERRGVRCTDTEGNCLELTAEPGGRYQGHRVTGFSGLHSESLDLGRTADFYQRFLGFTAAAEGPGWLALALPNGQRWVFHHVDELSPAMRGPYAGRHFAFAVDDATFATIVGLLHAAGVEEGDVRGGRAGAPAVEAERKDGELGTYFNDPDGLRLQILNHDSAHAAAGKVLLRYTSV
jgi:predicted enzyme related to lactoylglutathione lyase